MSGPQSGDGMDKVDVLGLKVMHNTSKTILGFADCVQVPTALL